MKTLNIDRNQINFKPHEKKKSSTSHICKHYDLTKKGFEPLSSDYEPDELTFTLFCFKHKCFQNTVTYLNFNYQKVLLFTLFPEVKVMYTI